QLARLVEEYAQGAAGTPWDDWQPTPPGRGWRPGLLRIGDLAGYRLPALVPLLDAAHVTVTGGDPARADGVIAGLLLRAVGSAPPGSVVLRVYDPERLGGSLAGFAPLASAGLLTSAGPGSLPDLLDELVREIRRVNEYVLAGEYASLAALAEATGRRPEPWRIAVLLGNEELRPEAAAQLDRIVRTGLACGVHVVTRGRRIPGAVAIRLPPPGAPIRPAGRAGTADRGGSREIAARTSLTGAVPVELDEPPPPALVTAVCRQLAAGPPPAVFADLIPEKLWGASAAEALTAPVGEGPDGRLVELTLGDNPPHALIGGASGSGKTNLIYAWLAGLTTRYSPDELELYLLDFKEGVSFARFAPGSRDPSWLPHVKLVGVNINGDREFGLALLRYLVGELRARAAAARRYEATKLSELRAEDPAGRWPRIVAVIDEFQVLLAGRDAVTGEAVALLEDLARRGRSQGIHLILASQDVSGIEALWGRGGLIGQFTLRIALPKARRILSDANGAAETIPRYHAVVNPDSGVVGANQVVRLPDSGARGAWQELQQRLWEMRAPTDAPPRLFDGDAVPPLVLPAPSAVGEVDEPAAYVGELIDVTGRPAVVRLGRAPGRNVAILGTRADDACAILRSMALTVARQWPQARFSVLCPDSGLADRVAPLAEALGVSIVDGPGLVPFLAGVTPDVRQPHVLVGYALDAAAPLLSAKPAGGAGTARSGHDMLRRLLAGGPEHHTHLLGWWRSVGRLRDDLGGIAARFDAIGAWVALDLQGSELAPLSPVPGGPAWYPRPHRGLFFDRAVHRHPEVVIPYGTGA
ncbi:MAG TPA: FtsK/SpoIIIE domain-containing protein, partial [Rugosimonospora sp.]|nr:FtsK/SpoIIIE domain-containing protein [Rugosimonospora sp.]